MDRDPQEHRAPLWMRPGIWLVAASGPLPFMLDLAGLVAQDATPLDIECQHSWSASAKPPITSRRTVSPSDKVKGGR